MSIQLQLENMGPMKEAAIELDALTVLVGDNDTGKSLICKSFYLMVNGLGMGQKQIKQFLKDNVYNESHFACEDCLSRLLIKNQNGEVLREVSFNPFELAIHDGLMEYNDSIYVESPLIINEKIPKEFTSMWYIDDLKYRLLYPKSEDNFKVSKTIMAVFDQMVEGDIVKPEKEPYFYYKQKDGRLVESVNTPNGLKTLLLLKKLYINGYLTKGTLLMLDETEIFLHPAWQLRYARILSLLIKECQLTLLINTASLYFIEALEMFSNFYHFKSRSHFYLCKSNPKGTKVSDEKEDIQKIYDSLLEAFEELDDMRIAQEEED